MAERSPVDSPADLTADLQFLGRDHLTVKSYHQIPGTHDSILDDDPDRLLNTARKFEDMPTAPNQTEDEVGASCHGSYKPFNFEGNPFHKFIRTEECGLIELDIEKLEREIWSLSLYKTTEDPAQKKDNVTFLRDNVADFFTTLEQSENSSKTALPEAEPRRFGIPEERNAEKLTEFKYEKKNKLWDRKPYLKQMCKEFFEDKYGKELFTEKALESISEWFLNYMKLELQCGINVLRRIAYPKLCEKHFSPGFPTGTFAEEVDPVENINISMDHFEFLHKESPQNFLDLIKREDFDSFVSDLEKDPKINNIVPSFEKFLKSGDGFNFPQKCFTVISAILKNPYRTFEFFYDEKLPVVKEQTAIAEYLMNCLHTSNILTDEVISEKLAETIIMFANISPPFLAKIVAGITDLLNDEKHSEHFYQIYCKVLIVMTSIGATIIKLCLPQHFERISCLAANDRNCELYFHLLRACEILITDTVENGLLVEAEFSDENDSDSFYSACYDYFGCALTTRLIPVFRKYEKRKDREEQYLSKKHAIFPTKEGYMNLEMRYLTNRNKKREESESLNFPRIKKCTFNSAGKVLFSSSHTQLGYIIQKDMSELPSEDLEYWTSIDQFPISYLEGVTDILTKNN